MKHIKKILPAPGKSYIQILKELKIKDNKKGSFLSRFFSVSEYF